LYEELLDNSQFLYNKKNIPTRYWVCDSYISGTWSIELVFQSSIIRT
jgi:hypothetical protein